MEEQNDRVNATPTTRQSERIIHVPCVAVAGENAPAHANDEYTLTGQATANENPVSLISARIVQGNEEDMELIQQQLQQQLQQQNEQLQQQLQQKNEQLRLQGEQLRVQGDQLRQRDEQCIELQQQNEQLRLQREQIRQVIAHDDEEAPHISSNASDEKAVSRNDGSRRQGLGSVLKQSLPCRCGPRMKWAIVIAVVLVILGVVLGAVLSTTTAIIITPGIEFNVPQAEVEARGWTLCYTGFYGNETMEGKEYLCDGNHRYVMMGCRPVGNTDWTLVGSGHTEKAFTDTGTGNTGTMDGDIQWYFNDDCSMGFAPSSVSIDRNSCDTLDTSAESRLCWYTQGSTGHRCGATEDLYDSSWERAAWKMD